MNGERDSSRKGNREDLPSDTEVGIKAKNTYPCLVSSLFVCALVFARDSSLEYYLHK